MRRQSAHWVIEEAHLYRTDLDPRLPDVVAGAQQLLDPGFDFHAAIARYAAAIEQYGNARQRVYTLDMLLKYGSTA